ncbi:MAG: hypothetical protein H0X13_18820 [Ramlibacter sp.]|nr:hypothetical protein [Ramlibacter sp.]
MALNGCAMVGKLLGIEPTSPLRHVKVVAELDANSLTATAIDLVFVYDDTALAVLPKTGPEWFANKDALMAGLALSVDVVRLQIPRGKTVDEAPLPRRHRKAVAVYSYANYITPGGQPQGKLTPYKCAQITLGASAISYQSCAS